MRVHGDTLSLMDIECRNLMEKTIENAFGKLLAAPVCTDWRWLMNSIFEWGRAVHDPVGL